MPEYPSILKFNDEKKSIDFFSKRDETTFTSLHNKNTRFHYCRKYQAFIYQKKKNLINRH